MSDNIFFIKVRHDHSLMKFDVSNEVGDPEETGECEPDKEALPDNYERIGLEALFPARDQDNHDILPNIDQRRSSEIAFDDVTLGNVIANYRMSKSKLSKLKLPAKPKRRNITSRYGGFTIGYLDTEPDVMYTGKEIRRSDTYSCRVKDYVGSNTKHFTEPPTSDSLNRIGLHKQSIFKLV
ncbi:hypothetical protein LSH36_647g01003 [Paralvinella palmiformis]|uniref:Uncharacterized protein n=1 Tax=Paralvinella palmiformis TaxID=53620 RepID=A0AAD9MW05_9ANNE|nr:hypothetical protein LSH36_647g01003 [Paralvinella palmiformis]